MRRRAALLMAALCLGLLCPATSHAQDEAGRVIQRARAAYANIGDYTCSFSKKESVKGEFSVEERNIFLKYKKGPNIYMMWTEGDMRGTEAIYPDIANASDKVVVHGGGLLPAVTLRLDPSGDMAMNRSRHPITEVGIGYLIDQIDRNYRLSKTTKEGSVTCQGTELVEGRRATHLKARFPENSSFYGPDIDVYFDEASSLPVLMQLRDASGEIVEEYAYKDIRINVGLARTDFDPGNPQYRY